MHTSLLRDIQCILGGTSVHLHINENDSSSPLLGRLTLDRLQSLLTEPGLLEQTSASLRGQSWELGWVPWLGDTSHSRTVQC